MNKTIVWDTVHRYELIYKRNKLGRNVPIIINAEIVVCLSQYILNLSQKTIV